jgi:hypothetical protein
MFISNSMLLMKEGKNILLTLVTRMNLFKTVHHHTNNIYLMGTPKEDKLTTIV